MEQASALPLTEIDVLVIDCQATAAAPRGHLLELGWGVAGPVNTCPQARLIRLPSGQRIPPPVARITGISDRMSREGVDAQDAWRELTALAASSAQQPAPAVAHFARFERPFVRTLAAGPEPFDLVCTHEIARRLLPDLPRCSLRALTGYFGRSVGALRRSAEHVEATAFVWRELVRLLENESITTWEALHGWLDVPPRQVRRLHRGWPLPRDQRLSLPDVPGVYRLLRTNGDVLYVGKASSLRHRVNSYFRKQHGVPERTLEMLSQARAVSFAIAPTALEAALLEPDEIKRHAPPYNIALTDDDRAIWFAPPDLSARSRQPSPRFSVGPFPSGEVLDQHAALAHASRSALGRGRWAPDPHIFDEGYARVCAAHRELSCTDLGPHSRLLRLGTRLWREGRRDCDLLEDEESTLDRKPPQWTAERVQTTLERIAIRAALARRRARWLTRMTDAAVVWTEPGASHPRLIVIEGGEIVRREDVEDGRTPAIPPGHSRTSSARHAAFTVARFDRLRVLTTELKRLTFEGAPVALRLGRTPVLADARLAYALSWV